MTLKLRICVRLAAIFYMEHVAVLTMTWSYQARVQGITLRACPSPTVGNTTVFHGRYSLFQAIVKLIGNTVRIGILAII